ncbi:unnamed protein product [Hymenolepis diminuta]|uniref:Cyclin N-terminal domain-containing protein n=1 Tax=Hymenolepis diminuta TaxID=6216 RepID=A0A0R3SRN3_HYMDI|nr:unnamed protein product [Hymenolepis diminuta]VUZ52102.1 unnamed protein product [Hymenolepis diminuta]
MNLAKRQQCACLIQEIGSRMSTTQVVINSALCYMQYFYERFSPDTVKPIFTAITTLYIASKTEDYSRKLSFIIGAAYNVLKKQPPDQASSVYHRIVRTIHSLEGILLMVIGFRKMDIKHPHIILIEMLRKSDIPKEVATCSYFVCSNILHFTTLFLRHSPEAIAAVSLYVAAKWLNFDIKAKNESWFHVFSKDLKFDEIRKMAEEFIVTFNAVDVKIKEQVRDTFKNTLTRQRQHEEQMRGLKRPYDSQGQLNVQGVNPHAGMRNDVQRPRAKIPRASQSPNSQPSQVPNQPLPGVPDSDSANAFKRDGCRQADASSGSNSRTSSSLKTKLDLTNYF